MDTIIKKIREFNRFYTNTLGLLNDRFLDGSFSLTEARILYEIGSSQNCAAKNLIELLNLDKGYLSRILRRFETNGLLQRTKDKNDNRISYLKLTEKGSSILYSLTDASNNQISNLIKKIPLKMRYDLLKNMQSIENILSNKFSTAELKIRDIKPGDLGYIIHSHGILYAKEYGFDQTFENYVLQGVAHFINNKNANDKIWVADFMDNIIVGSIAIVETEHKVAQLRWFLTEPEFRNQGIGKNLLQYVSDYCQGRFNQVFLWTLSTLESARYLYNKFGFNLTETKTHFIWGHELTEERWDLYL